jgi:hypothetical protein
MHSRVGVLRLALAFTALIASMTLVVWRQSRALELLRELEQARMARAIGEADRSELMRRIELLESRAQVVSTASVRLGLRVPSADEIIILPLGMPVPGDGSTRVVALRSRGNGASLP